MSEQFDTVDVAPALQRAESASRELGQLMADQAERAIEVAREVGYQGAMTVGGLEDEIRFYQRRTVEAILETGKRLLVLKELSAHGEFSQRVELLGMSGRTAQRFMQAAAKTAKSANLALLSTQVKSASAFLELVTHDDDVLDGLKDMDDVDRMSASELRKTVRELQEDRAATDRVLADKDRKLNELSRKGKKFDLTTDWPAEAAAAIEVVDATMRGVENSLNVVIQACSQAMAVFPDDADADKEAAYATGAVPLATRVRDGMQRLRELVDTADAHFQQTLGNFLD